MKSRCLRCWAGFLTLALAGSLGCATARVDWDSRVGTYTRDDAIRELGPPDRSAQLSDGTTVAEWLTGRGTQTATVVGGGWGGGWHPYGPYGWGGPNFVVVDPPSPNRFLRLTFDPQGRLASWQRVYK